MSFLTTTDYYLTASIASENLDQVLKQARNKVNDYTILENVERIAISICEDYISARYRTDLIFKPFIDFNIATTYTWNDRIYYTADDFSATTIYTIGLLVEYNGSIYENIYATPTPINTLPTNATYWTLRGQEGIHYIAPPEKFDDSRVYVTNEYVTYNYEIYKKNSNVMTIGVLPTNAVYFEKIYRSAYSLEFPIIGVYPINASWTFGDNRNMSMVRTVIDLALFDLHNTINPRNIPALRKTNYDNAIKYLDALMSGMLNPVLPGYGAQKGYKIRFGSNEQFNSTY